MTDETPDTSSVASSDDGSSLASASPGPVFLVSYPKLVFLYPTVLAALFGAIFMLYNGNEPKQEYARLPGCIFLLVMMVNFVVIAFDFPRTTSLTWFFAIVAVSVGLWATASVYPDFAPWASRQMHKVSPAANAEFYIIYVLAMMFLFTCVMVSRRFDYWEVRGNELLHHHGVLSDLERFSAPNLRIDKEINDIFEYILLRSGRLILHPSQERRAIVLENVFFINQKEERITKMLGALQVRIRTDHT
jgi:hypothetical protein